MTINSRLNPFPATSSQSQHPPTPSSRIHPYSTNGASTSTIAAASKSTSTYSTSSSSRSSDSSLPLASRPLPAYGNPNEFARPSAHYFPTFPGSGERRGSGSSRNGRDPMEGQKVDQSPAQSYRREEEDRSAGRREWNSASQFIDDEAREASKYVRGQSPSNTSIRDDRRETERIDPRERNLQERRAAGDEEDEEGAGEEDGEDDTPARKRSRTLTTGHQTAVLNTLLAKTRFPSTETREEVGFEIGMSARRVQIWFQNRRQSQKRARDREVIDTPSSGGHFPQAQRFPSQSSSYPYPPGSSQGYQNYSQVPSNSHPHPQSYPNRPPSERNSSKPLRQGEYRTPDPYSTARYQHKALVMHHLPSAHASSDSLASYSSARSSLSGQQQMFQQPPQQHLVPNSRNLPASVVRNMARTKIDGDRSHENGRESGEGDSYRQSQLPWSPSNQPPPLPSLGSTSTAAMSHAHLPPIQTNTSHFHSQSNPNANVNNGFTFAWPSRGSSNLNKANPSSMVEMNGGSDRQPVPPTAGALLSGIYLPPMDTSAPINVRKDSGLGIKLPSISSMFGSSISPSEGRDDEGGRKLNYSVSYNGNSRGSTASAGGRDRESFSAGGRELAGTRSFTSDRSNRSILSPDEGPSMTSPLERLGRLRLNSLPPMSSGDNIGDGQTISPTSSTRINGPSLGLIIEPISSGPSNSTPAGILPRMFSRSENLSPTSPNRSSTRLPSISSFSTYPSSLTSQSSDYLSNKREREPEGGGGGGKRDSIGSTMSLAASGSTWSHGSSFSGSGASSLFLHNSDNTPSGGGRNYDYSRNRNSTSTTASTLFEYDAPPPAHLSAPNSAPSTGTSGDTCGTGTSGGGYKNHVGSRGRRRNGSDSSRTSFGSEVLADWEGLGLTKGGEEGERKEEEEEERMEVN